MIVKKKKYWLSRVVVPLVIPTENALGARDVKSAAKMIPATVVALHVVLASSAGV